MSIIKDGTGTKRAAKVGSTNRLNTDAVSRPSFEDAVINGDGFLVVTNSVTLTTAGESGILYLKNDECDDIFIDTSIVQWGNAKDACCAVIVGGNYKTRSYFNPTGGTLISCGTAGVATNINLGSGSTACVTVVIGAEGLTLTSPGFAEDLMGEPGRTIFKSNIIIPKGNAIAISFVPPTGTASVDVIFETFFYRIIKT